MTAETEQTTIGAEAAKLLLERLALEIQTLEIQALGSQTAGNLSQASRNSLGKKTEPFLAARDAGMMGILPGHRKNANGRRTTHADQSKARVD